MLTFDNVKIELRDGQIKVKFHTYVNPQRQVPSEAFHVHGLREA